MKSLKWVLLTAALMVLTFVTVSGTLGDTKANEYYLSLVQSELMRSDSGLVDAADTRMLLPAVYAELTATDTPLQCSFPVTKGGHSATANSSTTQAMYNAKNTLDYIVVDTNVGNTDGYVRTWFAFEMGDLTEDEFEAAVVLNRNTDDWTWGEIQYDAVISGQRYAVACAEYVDAVSKDKKALPAGETTAPSLLQVMLRNTVSNETAERLDGNSDGKYEIKVTSRIVSDAGAWGALTGHPFPTVVNTAEELQNAINSGAENIILGENIDLGGGIIIN